MRTAKRDFPLLLTKETRLILAERCIFSLCSARLTYKSDLTKRRQADSNSQSYVAQYRMKRIARFNSYDINLNETSPCNLLNRKVSFDPCAVRLGSPNDL